MELQPEVVLPRPGLRLRLMARQHTETSLPSQDSV